VRVCWLTPDKPADISVGRRRIADRLEREGFDVTLRGTTPTTVRGTLRERSAYDAVVGTTRAGAFAGLTTKALGTPLVVDHVDPIRQFETTHPRWLAAGVRAGENLAFRVADHVLYVYEEEARRVRRYARAATETDLGVAFERFADPPSDVCDRARERLEAAGVEGPTVVYVGGLEPIYHVGAMLDAARYLDDWTLVVLGAGSLAPAVERAASEHENVVFLGTVDHADVPGYLHAADVGVSLVDDPHTLKLLEYGAAGLGVVQARGRAEGRFGEHVAYADPTGEDVARAVRAAVDRADGGAFREFVRRFDYGRVAEDYARVLRDVVGRR
jgi:glycosyltransferase involved in cell wall biosynthesis